jgi:hypothetical protein
LGEVPAFHLIDDIGTLFRIRDDPYFSLADFNFLAHTYYTPFAQQGRGLKSGRWLVPMAAALLSI